MEKFQDLSNPQSAQLNDRDYDDTEMKNVTQEPNNDSIVIDAQQLLDDDPSRKSKKSGVDEVDPDAKVVTIDPRVEGECMLSSKPFYTYYFILLFLLCFATPVLITTSLNVFIQSAVKNTTYEVRITVWKFHEFSITQILCEINFGDPKSAKYAILTHSENLNMVIMDFCNF